MIYRWLADLVVVFHLGTAVFALFGGFVCFANPWLAIVHLPLAIWVSIALIFKLPCPLTPLENWLQKRAGSGGYEGGFINHYIARPLGLVPERECQLHFREDRRFELVLGIGFTCLTLVVHGANWPQYQRWFAASTAASEVLSQPQSAPSSVA